MLDPRREPGAHGVRGEAERPEAPQDEGLQLLSSLSLSLIFLNEPSLMLFP